MGNTLIDQTFLPDASDPRRLRDALGCFATGITLITTQTENGPVGFTANSFASVSLDPPLVLWSAARSATRFPVFAAAQTYSIHILAQDQADLVTRFARSGAGFDGLAAAHSSDGNPIIPLALARFDCRQHNVHDGGDHLIIVGRVIAFALGQGAPLLFSQGTLGQFSSQP